MLVPQSQMNPNHVNLLDPTQVNRLAPSKSRLLNILSYFVEFFRSLRLNCSLAQKEVKKKKKSKDKWQNIWLGNRKAPLRAGNSRLVNLREWSWSRPTAAFFSIYCRNSQWATQTVYQQIPHRNGTKLKMLNDTSSLFTNSQSRIAHKGALQMLSAPIRLSWRWIILLAILATFWAQI